MDENFQNYNHHWLPYNNFHQEPNNGLLEIPFPNNAIPEGSSFNSDHFFMDPEYADVSRFPTDHGEIIPKEGSNSTAAFTEEDSSGRKESSGKVMKRRSRASRRTPPMLLNASVKNFRDLVQQYTGCESSSGKNQKGPINLSFGSSNDDHHHHQQQQQQQIDHFAQIPGFDGRYDHQNYHHEHQSFHEYDHVKQGFM